MKLVLLIGAGGFIGSSLRYLISLFFQSKVLTTFPFGTFAVNILGCFLIGAVYALSDRGDLGAEWRLFLATGILGGFTTFSSFSNETVSMMRDAQYGSALLYVVSSVILGLLATFLGIFLIKLF